uniref:Uncharacterized protein n=1 Tax=Sparus aurata TaxID=8175 RepID=A0A671VG71_SPAAU
VASLTLDPASRPLALILLTCDSAMSALSSASSSSCCSLRSLVRWLLVSVTHPGLQLLDLLLATFHGYLLSFIQTVLQVFDGLFHVFLHTLQIIIGTESIIQLQLSVLSRKMINLISAASLSLQGALQSVRHPLMVTLGLLHLLVFLSQLPLNLSLHLVELELNPKDLTLFMLQRALKETTLPSIRISFEDRVKALTTYCTLTSASSRAVCISTFSCSSCLRIFSSSWMLFPPSPSCSVRSEISPVIKRTLYSLYCMNSIA